MQGVFIYNTDLFDRSTVERLAGHFSRLLAALAAAPESPIDRLPMLAEAEVRQVLVDWNRTATPLADELLVHQRIPGRQS